MKNRPARKSKTLKPPTPRQLQLLRQIGVTDKPEDRTRAQALIAKHYRPRSKRGQGTREAKRRARQKPQ